MHQSGWATWPATSAFGRPGVTLNGGVISVTLVLSLNAFRSAGQTVYQYAVDGGLDAVAASGSLDGLVTAMANLPIAQGSGARFRR